ncbi:MT-A70-domain-containing protein [Peziza echinospora]|nr:MT-A70-domain-containing protein [Peziza echinospora]
MSASPRPEAMVQLPHYAATQGTCIMDVPAVAQPILYRTTDTNAILIDIPTSISRSCPQKLLSAAPLDRPYALPEPKDPSIVFNQELLDFHQTIREVILAALRSLRMGYQGEWCLQRRIREMALGESLPPFMTADFKANLNLLQVPVGQEPLDITELQHGVCIDITDIYNCIVRNPSPVFHGLTITTPANGRDIFTIPPGSSFLLAPFQASIDTFADYASRIGKFDFVLLDPPWPNRSAERSKAAYETLLNTKDLLRIPLEISLRDDALVGVWVTNKPKWRKFVLERLFPKWGIVPVGEWIWLKVTKFGEPIFDLDSVMRKPYEVLLFGRRMPRRPIAKTRKYRRGPDGMPFPSPEVEPSPRMLPTKVITAVPDLHSRKPCLKEGWLTWGDEAIRFNASEHWAPG